MDNAIMLIVLIVLIMALIAVLTTKQQETVESFSYCDNNRATKYEHAKTHSECVNAWRDATVGTRCGRSGYCNWKEGACKRDCHRRVDSQGGSSVQGINCHTNCNGYANQKYHKCMESTNNNFNFCFGPRGSRYRANLEICKGVKRSQKCP